MMRLSFVLSLFLVFATSVFADTPVGPMNYQGRLLDDGGIPLTGNYNFVVRVYDAVSGGILKYQENHNAVAVDDGVYALLVGTQTKSGGDSTWSVELWNCCTNLFMEIVVNGEALTPRHRLAAAPYAFQANLALTTNNALALGGKSAAEYDNILGAICESSKGKWLELVQKCLGAGSSFPGSAATALSTLTASTDLTNLDLGRADISGINFGTANLSGTSFDKATLNVFGIKNANLSNTILTGITSNGGATVTANLSGALIGNTNLSGWSMGGATLTGASIADLLACPSALPANFICYEQNMPTSGKKVIFGPTMNFSTTSVLNNRFNGTDISDPNIFGVANLTGANFAGNNIDGISFHIAPLTNASFRNTNIRRSSFGGSLDNASFANATMLNSGFYSSMVGTDFTGANLSNVTFGPGNGSSLNFAYANLVNPIFINGPTNLNLYFEASSLTNPSFAAGITSLNFNESTRIFGGLYLGDQVTYVYFMETYFSGGNVSGNYTDAEFSGGGSTFYNVSFNGANFTGATALGNSQFFGVNWFGAICPDGFPVTTQGGTCVGHFDP